MRELAGKIKRRAALAVYGLPKPPADLPMNPNSDKQRDQLRHMLRAWDRIRGIRDTIEPAVDTRGELTLMSKKDTVAVMRQAFLWSASDNYFRDIMDGVSPDQAFINMIHTLLPDEGRRPTDVRRARAISAAYRDSETGKVPGTIATAMIAADDGLPDYAWDLLSSLDRERVIELAPAEYFEVGLTVAPDHVVPELRKYFDEGKGSEISAWHWLRIAKIAFATVHEDISRQALDCAEVVAREHSDEELIAEIEWLRRWYGARDAAMNSTTEPPAGTIPFAVLDYKQPDKAFSSKNLGDMVQTIASLGHFVRQDNFSFTGDEELVALVDRLRSQRNSSRVVSGESATFSLYRMDRDASNYFDVPPGTWSIGFGWYMHQMFGVKYDVPFNPNLRPIFVSFHVNAPSMLTEETLAYLKQYEPIGCRDWNTSHLLNAAGVDAFFSGCLTTTIDNNFEPFTGTRPDRTLYVDVDPPHDEEFRTQVFPEVCERSVTENADDALRWLEDYRSGYSHIVTSRLHCNLPARSLGANVDFQPKNPADVRFDGLAGINETQFNAIRDGILSKLEVILGHIARGESETDVYAAWRELCAGDVAFAKQTLASDPPIPETSFDIAEACRQIHKESVTNERTVIVPGEEVAIEFSLDANFKQQLEVTLESIVRTTTRPIRAYVLTRGLDDADRTRVVGLFPQVSFVWLPTDHVDYGTIVGMIEHITVATMDRLLLPELLPEVNRIVHFDLDAIARGDVGELFDVDLGGAPIAARTSPQPTFESGFAYMIRMSKRLRKDEPAARELIRRSHSRHSYDFRGFNAGIMVLDLAQMRSDDFCREFLPWVERFGLNDQEVLNVYAGANRAELDADWNRLPRVEDIDNAKVVHWAGFHKPWKLGFVAGKHEWESLAEDVANRV